MPWSKIEPEFHEPDFYTKAERRGRTLSYAEAMREGLRQSLSHDP